MAPEIKAVPMHSDEGRKHLTGALPALRTMDDESAVNALVELYDLGVEAGVESGMTAMKDMAQWLSRIIAAHIKQDALEVKAILDEFIADRCVIKGGPTPTVPH